MGRRTDLGQGSVQIQNEVIGSIALMAAQEVEGVAGVWQGPGPLRFLRVSPGVRVEAREQEVRIGLDLIVEYGAALPDVGARVQDRVREVVEQMTQLTPAEVQVSIRGVRPKRSETR